MEQDFYKPRTGDTIEGEISGLAFGGQGILKKEGFVVFVPFTAPGDKIRCRLTAVKKNFAEGELATLLHPGPGRTAPHCRHFGQCGGCQLQHLDYSLQLAYKQKSVADALERIGKVPLPALPPITAADPIWGYRRHVTLTFEPSAAGYAAGYKGIDGASLIPVEECPIFTADDRIFIQLNTLLDSFDAPRTAGRAVILKAHGGAYILSLHLKRLPSNCRKAIEAAVNSWEGWAGIDAAAPGQSITYGNPTISENIEGLTITFSPGAFIQNHAAQSINIYRDIVALAGKSSQKKVLDLYCGIGISSLLLGRAGHTVLGVECNSEAIVMATQNRDANGICGVDFAVSDVAKGLRQRLKAFKPGAVVVNPPRGGLANEVALLLGREGPQHIFYVSCMPPTLARDVGLLCSLGYKAAECRLYDMFPQTSHVETLVELVRGVS